VTGMGQAAVPKKNKKGKRKKKGLVQGEPGVADEGEAKGQADDQVAGEGGQSDGAGLAAEHGRWKRAPGKPCGAPKLSSCHLRGPGERIG
jgi:hypothetical protein